MRVGWVSLVWLVCLVGCDDLEPEGTYSGLVSGSTQISTLLSGPDEDGNLNARAQNANVSRSDVNVTVRRTGDSRLEITLDDGRVVSVTPEGPWGGVGPRSGRRIEIQVVD